MTRIAGRAVFKSRNEFGEGMNISRAMIDKVFAAGFRVVTPADEGEANQLHGYTVLIEPVSTDKGEYIRYALLFEA